MEPDPLATPGAAGGLRFSHSRLHDEDTGRGGEMFLPVYSWLDIVPKGRNDQERQPHGLGEAPRPLRG
jgi:hypothetical protein